MPIIAFLICFPFAAALFMAFLKKAGKVRKFVFLTCCTVIIAVMLFFVVTAFIRGGTTTYLPHTPGINALILAGEWVIVALVAYYSFRYKKYYAFLLSIAQTGLITWLELSGKTEIPGDHILTDNLTLIMCLIVGGIGGLICVYAIGYMKDYHEHHKEFKDRRNFFFSMLFVFLGAMFGLVFSSNLTWMYFFWEITSICSFLLIGYSQTPEAIHNSFRALWMNLLGGLGFALAITYSAAELHIIGLEELAASADGLAVIPVILLAFAALTKSAQMPFSGWLLGAMVAPTPTSALLHSATMVKAGVYLLIRLSPAMAGNVAGLMVTTVGGFTFLAASCLAIAQSDGKKVLAYSTVSNLGLIAACAGVGNHEAVWAGILLMMFHAVSKSMLFQSVGAVENSIGSRNIEDMHGLIVRLPRLAFIMIVGICGMFLAPFGMLVSKWAALRAFIDSKSILLVVFLIYGSATTLFYWGKWLGSLVAVHNGSKRQHEVAHSTEWVSLITHAAVMIVLLLTFPLASSYLIEPFLSVMFQDSIPDIIGRGNVIIMLMMLIAIAVLPVVLRILSVGEKNKIVNTYMAGINHGDDRTFTDSMGGEKSAYLANWYLEDYFGEKRLLKPSLIFSSAVIIVLIVLGIGGMV